MIAGPVTPAQNGKISAAGPGSNLVVGAVFLIAATTVARTASASDLVGLLVSFIFVNAWYMNVILAGFNMIPVLPFDGAKVWAWNKAIYLGIIGLVIAMYLSGVYLGIAYT